MSDRSDTTAAIVTLKASRVRRLFALVVLLALAFMLLWIGAVRPPVHAGWRIFLLVDGFLMLWLAEMLRQATRLELHLSEDALRDSNGRILARVDQITAVERGLFAFKPSNGFLLRLNVPVRRGWAPGVYWSVGRRVGVGGVTSASDAKAMAEVISAMLARRAAGGE